MDCTRTAGAILYLVGYIVGMRALRAEVLSAVLRPLADARPFGREAYVDEDVFAFEQARIFRRSWACVGRVDGVARPGEWLRAVVAGEPVLVVRGADLELRAFFDVCRHRGASLSGGACAGRSAALTCPYHRWRYALDGRLLSPRTDERLRAASVDVWRGFVFVAIEASAPLAEWVAGAPPWLGEELLVRRVRQTRWVAAANWKLLAQNFQESHHFPSVHAGLEALTPAGAARTWSGPGRWLGGTMEIEGAETVSLDGSRHGRPLVSRERRVFDAMLFPSLLTSLQPDYLLTYRLAPISAGQTEVTAEFHFHPAAAPDAPDVFAFWDRVNAEDRAICEDQQRNARSSAFDPAGYADVEEGVHAFDRMVAACHRDGGLLLTCDG